MSFWELLAGTLIVSLISILAAPALWSSYGGWGELLKRWRNDRTNK